MKRHFIGFACCLTLVAALFACNKGNNSQETPVIEVRGVFVHPSTLTLKIGDTQTLSTTIIPENATDKTIVWSSSRPDVAKVDENGKVTAVSSGEVTITATSVNGIQGKCTVSVGKLSSNANTEPLQEFQVL